MTVNMKEYEKKEAELVRAITMYLYDCQVQIINGGAHDVSKEIIEMVKKIMKTEEQKDI